MKDYTNIKRLLLEEFLQEQHNEAEVEAFVKGMNWLEDALFSDEYNGKLNPFVPDKVALSNLQLQYDNLMTEHEKLEKKNKKLEDRLKKLLALSKKEKKELRKDAMVKSIVRENERLIYRISELQVVK